MEKWALTTAPGFTRPRLTGPQTAVLADPSAVSLVMGGPGTGKTLTLVEDVVSHVQGGAPLDRLVVLATSRAQAQELRRQITLRLDRAQVSPRVTTVHGFALGLLRQEPDAAFRLLRAPEQELRIREILAGLPADFWPADIRDAAGTRAFARQLREFLARARQLGLDPRDIADSESGLQRAVGAFAEQYLDIADFEGTLDYAELVHRARLHVTQPSVAASLAAGFDGVWADDVQDYDAAQASLLGDLVHAGIPLRAFLDPQQRTGSFRGATAQVVPILTGLPGARVHHLRQGHRMGSAVADAASHLRQRLSATHAAPSPTPAPGLQGEVQVLLFDAQAAELAHVAAQMRTAHFDEGVPWHEMAVMARTGRRQLTPLAHTLMRHGVPVEVSGDELPISEQHAVRHLFLALHVASLDHAPTPEQAAQLLAGPLARLDGVAQRRLARALARAHPDPDASDALLAKALGEPRLLAGLERPEAARAGHLAGLLSRAARALEGGARVGEVLWGLWNGTGWPAELQRSALEGSRTAHLELDAVVELFDVASRHEDLVGAPGARTFMSEVAGQDIVADNARELEVAGRGARLLTAHRARTGQWRKVWIVGVQEGVWPRGHPPARLLDPERLTDPGAGQALVTHLADERRLFHAACTRASETLTVTATRGGDPEGSAPSRFCFELGVTPREVQGVEAGNLTATALVADLRRHLMDPSASPSLRRAAALRLARLARDPARRSPFRDADPSAWWGVRPVSAPSPEASEVLVLSGSSLQALLACPRRWFLTRRAKAGAGRSSQASVGDVVHAIAARADAQRLGVQEMKDHLDAVWGRIAFDAPWVSAGERAEMDLALERFDRWRRSNGNQLLGTEERFDVELEVSGRRVRLTGSVDRLELAPDGLRIVDYKTGRARPTRNEAATNEQLGVYQLAAALGGFDHLAPGERRVEAASLLMLRHGEVEPVEITQESLERAPAPGGDLTHGPTWVHDKLAEAVEILESGCFDARSAGACGPCPFKASCPASRTVEVGA